MTSLALIGFILMALLMFVLVREVVAPPVAFVVLPLLAALAAGFGLTDIAGFLKSGMNTMLSTVILFVFSISYFTMMSEKGLFDPIINKMVSVAGKKATLILFAVVAVTFVAHLDGSGATTYLIVVPAFLPILQRMGIRANALLACIAGMFSTMNVTPWAGPTMRAASVSGVETSTLYSFIMPAVAVMFLLAFGIAAVAWQIEKRRGVRNLTHEELQTNTAELKTSKPVYIFNLLLTLALLACLFLVPSLPSYAWFMIAYVIALVVNFPKAKEQNKMIKAFGSNAMVMTVTLITVGVFIGVTKETGMVKAMAESIVSWLPEALVPHTHWILGLFSVPLLMVLGTDAFYYAMLPIVINVVEPFGVEPSTVAATLLLTATWGTPISPSVAANYVGLGLADVSISSHIKYTIRLVWPASIITLVAATLLGVIKF